MNCFNSGSMLLLHQGGVAGFCDDVVAHGVPGAVRGFSGNARARAQPVPDIVDRFGMQLAGAAHRGACRQK